MAHPSPTSTSKRWWLPGGAVVGRWGLSLGTTLGAPTAGPPSPERHPNPQSHQRRGRTAPSRYLSSPSGTRGPPAPRRLRGDTRGQGTRGRDRGHVVGTGCTPQPGGQARARGGVGDALGTPPCPGPHEPRACHRPDSLRTPVGYRYGLFNIFLYF